jgi:hypothetical protein
MPLWIVALIVLVVADIGLQAAVVSWVRQRARVVCELAARPGPGVTTDDLYVAAAAALRSAQRRMVVLLLVSSLIVGAIVLALLFISDATS